MPKRSSSNPNVSVFRAAAKATEPSKLKKKNPSAVALGRLGGRAGGKARAKILSPERCAEIARRAAKDDGTDLRIAESLLV